MLKVDEKEEKSKPEDENEKPVVDQDEKPVVDLSKKPDPVEIDEKKEVKIEKTNVKSDSQYDILTIFMSKCFFQLSSFVE